MARSQLIGNWRLLSAELKDENGETSLPFGSDPVGYLSFLGGGYVAWAMMRSGRPDFQSSNPLEATEKERATAYASYFSYNGTSRVEGDKILIAVDISLFPNWTGSKQTRFFQVRGDHLQVHTPPMVLSGKTVVGTFAFERVAAAGSERSEPPL
jgi:hypothetical protein